MKLSTPALIVIAALLFAGGYATRCWQDRPAAALTAIRDSAAVLDTAAASLDSTIVQHHAGDSAAVAEPQHAARVHQQHAESLGDSVALLQAETDDALRLVATSDTNASRAAAALATERAAEARQAGEYRAAIADKDRAIAAAQAQVFYYRDTALVNMQGQRDKARRLLAEAIAIQTPRSWSTLRRVITAAACVTTGVAAVKGKDVVTLVAGAGCGGSLALR